MALIRLRLVCAALCCVASSAIGRAESFCSGDNPSDAIVAADNDAIQRATQKLNAAPTSADKSAALVQRAATYLQLSQDYGNCSSFDLSEANLRKAMDDDASAIRMDPKNAAAFLRRGLNDDDDKKAMADLTAAINLHSLGSRDAAIAYLKRGEKRLFADGAAPAVADFSAAIGLEPALGPAYYGRARAYDRQKHPDLAAADYTAALSNDRNWSAYGTADAFYQRGQDYDSLGKHDLALADYTSALDPKAASRDPNVNRGWAYKGRAEDYERRGDYRSAIADYGALLDLGTLGPDGDADIHDARARDYDKIGNHDMAAKDRHEAEAARKAALCNQEGYEACSMDNN